LAGVTKELLNQHRTRHPVPRCQAGTGRQLLGYALLWTVHQCAVHLQTRCPSSTIYNESPSSRGPGKEGRRSLSCGKLTEGCAGRAMPWIATTGVGKPSGGSTSVDP
jgi:hypothetical protein